MMTILKHAQHWPPPNRNRRFQHGGKTLVAVLLLVTFGLFPAHQILHLFFADHTHRYCRIHYQIEDIYPTDVLDSILTVTEDPAHETVQPLDPASRAWNHRHHGCDILKLCFESKSAGSFQATEVRQPVVTLVAPMVWSIDFTGSCPLVLLSPKHSPPRASCH
ncbi:MAG: hypothetical protein GX414_14600 [Acidobacteria bacterium]|nr:hypothetical protein [Acidobacteriota bacterium]